MARTSIRTDNSSGAYRLGVAGRDVVAARDQIVTILRNRIGESAARLLTVAQTDDGDNGIVVWRSADGGSLTPVSELSTERAEALRTAYRELAAEIGALASRIAAESDSGRVAGHLIRLALVTPGGYQALHAAGDQPVLVNWGHAVRGQVVPELQGRPPSLSVSPASSGASPSSSIMAAEPVQESVAPVEHGSDGVPGSLDEGKRRTWWVAWVAPLLLLFVSGTLVWKLMQPQIPIVVERAPPLPPPEDPVPAAREALSALESELAAVQAVQSRLAALCEPVPEHGIEPPEPDQPPPGPTTAAAPSHSPPPVPNEQPAMVAEPTPHAERPARPSIPRRSPPELPPEVPRVTELPPQVAQLPIPPTPAPTLCEPRWTPTNRPEVIVVVDGSGSMEEGFPGGPSRIDAAKKATSTIVRGLHKDITTGLVSFTDCDETSTPTKYGYARRPELLARVAAMTPSQGTSLANSVRRAGNAAKSVGPATVVVVSDGEDTCGGDPCAVARRLKAKKPLLTINVLDLSDDRSAVLQCLAKVTGGRVFAPSNTLQMRRQMQEATGQPDASRCNS